jgi:hypothetical protein
MASKGLRVAANAAAERELLPCRGMGDPEWARPFPLLPERQRMLVLAIADRELPVPLLVWPDARLVVARIAKVGRPKTEPDGGATAELALVLKVLDDPCAVRREALYDLAPGAGHHGPPWGTGNRQVPQAVCQQAFRPGQPPAEAGAVREEIGVNQRHRTSARFRHTLNTGWALLVRLAKSSLLHDGPATRRNDRRSGTTGLEEQPPSCRRNCIRTAFFSRVNK